MIRVIFNFLKYMKQHTIMFSSQICDSVTGVMGVARINFFCLVYFFPDWGGEIDNYIV